MEKNLFINFNKLKVNLLFILLLFPYVQTSFQIFNPIVNKVILLIKIIGLFYVILNFINFKEKKVKMDSIFILVFICNFYMIIPTILHQGNLNKLFGYCLDSVGLIIVLKLLIKKYEFDFLQHFEFFLRLIIYVNFIFMLIFPNGVYVENNGYLTTRYLFLGMDNQAAIFVVTFMIIIYAIEKNKNKFSQIFIFDIATFFSSMLLMWVGNSIVAIFAFFVVLIIQKMTKKNFTIKRCMNLTIVLFIFIILLKGYEQFSLFIVNFLGKDLTLSGRTTIWANGIKEWLKLPLLGHGYQNTEALISFEGVKGYVRGAHNQILHILLHGGIMFLLFFYFIFNKLDKITKQYVDNKSINILILGILMNFIMGLADTYGHLVGLYMLIGLLGYGRNLFLCKKNN